MEKEIKELLESVLARQVVLFKKLDDIDRKMKGSTRLASIDVYAEELHKEAARVRI